MSFGAMSYLDMLAWIGAANNSNGVHDISGHYGMHNNNPTMEMMLFDFHGPPLLVESAFGGVGIYRRESIMGCRFSDASTTIYEKIYNKSLYACEVRVAGALCCHL